MSVLLRSTIITAWLVVCPNTAHSQPPDTKKLDERVKALEAEVSSLKKEIEQLKQLVNKSAASGGMPMGAAPENKATYEDVDVVLAQVVRSGTQVKLVFVATSQKDDVSFRVASIETVDEGGVTRKTEYNVDNLKLRKGVKTQYELILKDIPANVRMFTALEVRGRQGDTGLAGSRTLFTLKDIQIPQKK